MDSPFDGSTLEPPSKERPADTARPEMPVFVDLGFVEPDTAPDPVLIHAKGRVRPPSSADRLSRGPREVS